MAFNALVPVRSLKISNTEHGWCIVGDHHGNHEMVFLAPLRLGQVNLSSWVSKSTNRYTNLTGKRYFKKIIN